MQQNFCVGPAVQLNVPFLGPADARKLIGSFGFEAVNPDQVSSSADNNPDPFLIDYHRTNSFAQALDEGTKTDNSFSCRFRSQDRRRPSATPITRAQVSLFRTHDTGRIKKVYPCRITFSVRDGNAQSSSYNRPFQS